MSRHAVIWIDHKEARIFRIGPDDAHSSTVLAPQHHLHRAAHAREDAGGPGNDADRFFRDVARALDGLDAILILGPSSAKLEFFEYLSQHEHRLESKVVGVEAADHATDADLITRARTVFSASARPV